MNKIEAVIVDLDGTLLTTEKTITDYNKRAIDNLEAKGIKVYIATGRPFSSAKRFKDKVGLKNHCICTNGAVVIDGKTEKILDETDLQADIVKEVIKLARKYNIHFNMFQNEVWYVENYGEGHDIYKRESGLESVFKRFEDFEKRDMSKLILVDEHEKLLEIEKKIEYKLGDKLYKTFSRPYYLEILNKDVSKGRAVLKLLEIEKIKPENVMAFGDAENDIEMLENVGIGIAMENAMHSVKEIAKFIAKSNDDDGVGRYLNEYFNLGIGNS